MKTEPRLNQAVYGSLLQLEYRNRVANEQFFFSRHESWNTDFDDEQPAPEIEGMKFSGIQENQSGGFDVLYQNSEDTQGCLLHVTMGGKYVAVSVAGTSAEQVKALLATSRQIFPESKPKTGFIDVTFWTLAATGPKWSVRELEVPDLSDVEVNYNVDTWRGLTELRDRKFDASEGGKLVLWHGEPGTGKTFALRAMSHSWKHWCDTHYVVDPDNMFSHNSDYMMSILMGNNESKKWRLLVLEDTGELLGKDAKERSGQGLSRLLNVCDGLVGQGLKVIILITTNEPLNSLHAAVIRPGRCAANIHFLPLDIKEAEVWSKQHGYEKVPNKRGRSLAELYADAKDSAPALTAVPDLKSAQYI